MLGHKARKFKQHESISLEILVLENNFYRQVKHNFDLSFVHDLVDEFTSTIGFPTLDQMLFLSQRIYINCEIT